jgi:Amino acid permease
MVAQHARTPRVVARERSIGEHDVNAYTLARHGRGRGGSFDLGTARVGDKGLKKDALGFVSSCVIGVASTAPEHSLAASLGFVVAVAGVGLQAPAILLLAFVPMNLIASAYYYMNRADRTAARRSRGRRARSGVIGIELSARTQVGLLSAEIIALVLFSVVALVKVAAGDAGPDSVDPSLSWLNPFEIDSTSAMISGVLIAVFIYWGWDSTVTVNEESRDATEGPGRAALLATVILLAIYVVVAYAAQAYDGPQTLIDNADDVLSVLGTQVFGSPLDKILIIAVLTSAAASTQTTILPTARTSLSMAPARCRSRSDGSTRVT